MMEKRLMAERLEALRRALAEFEELLQSTPEEVAAERAERAVAREELRQKFLKKGFSEEDASDAAEFWTDPVTCQDEEDE